MGRVRVFFVPLVAVLLIGWAARPALAQTKEARGSVVAVSDSSLTVKVADKDMTFSVDAKTLVGAAETKGAPGIKLTSVVTTGSGVIVMYREASGAHVATEIRTVPAAASAGAGLFPTTASGKVKSVTAASLVITDNGKDLTFALDKDTSVGSPGILCPGCEPPRGPLDGSIAFTKVLRVGDNVRVSYASTGPTMRATDIRIIVTAGKAPTPSADR